MQTTSQLLMIRPVRFEFNAETAVNNAFQVAGNDTDTVMQEAQKEFDELVNKLRASGLMVTVINDTEDPHTPDSIFPNNWISMHEDGTVVLYPMFAPNRRAERKPHVLAAIAEKFSIAATVDLSKYESTDLFLEGTGSMVLDRENKIAYACISPRTHPYLLQEFGNRMGYSMVSFHAVDERGMEIYHTNVMMCVADDYVVICLDAITNHLEQNDVVERILQSGKEVIPISLHQMNHFAGNMLQVQNTHGEKLLVMSTQAFQTLTMEQVAGIEKYNPIVHSNLQTIETNGGGSARCMIAEVHLPLL